ncbi:MAG: helix-turn-helix transcriptional regulator [Thermoflavifilum sp.]|nr:helix-turn-helix transcriptional regulator [Thermoflavifilum sp.]MCL6513057.1 helix-turn-helix domain-containing protein [Alicyclobacillus sp.]
MNTGQRIAQLRKARGWTQAALAKQAGLSNSAIAMYETGRRRPDADALQRIARALEISTADLAAEEMTPTETAAASTVDSADGAGQPDHAAHAQHAVPVDPGYAQRPSAEVHDPYVSLDLTRDEARVILFLRMHPDWMPFFRAFITAEPRRQEQLRKAWDLIHRFQN